jgi:Restriction endonuclease fold toxin 7
MAPTAGGQHVSIRASLIRASSAAADGAAAHIREGATEGAAGAAASDGAAGVAVVGAGPAVRADVRSSAGRVGCAVAAVREAGPRRALPAARAPTWSAFSNGGTARASCGRYVASSAAFALEQAKEFLPASIAGIVKKTTRIASPTGRPAYRIPDVLNQGLRIIGEVKNVQYLAYTSQLQDFVAFAEANGYTFQLIVRAGTVLSAPLQAAADVGLIEVLSVLP